MYANCDAVKMQIISMNRVNPLSFTTTESLDMDSITLPVSLSTGRSEGTIAPNIMHAAATAAGAMNVECHPYALMRTVPITGDIIGPMMPKMATTESVLPLSTPSKQSLMSAKALTSAPALPKACIRFRGDYLKNGGYGCGKCAE